MDLEKNGSALYQNSQIQAFWNIFDILPKKGRRGGRTFQSSKSQTNFKILQKFQFEKLKFLGKIKVPKLFDSRIFTQKINFSIDSCGPRKKVQFSFVSFLNRQKTFKTRFSFVKFNLFLFLFLDSKNPFSCFTHTEMSFKYESTQYWGDPMGALYFN